MNCLYGRGCSEDVFLDLMDKEINAYLENYFMVKINEYLVRIYLFGYWILKNLIWIDFTKTTFHLYSGNNNRFRIRIYIFQTLHIYKF